MDSDDVVLVENEANSDMEDNIKDDPMMVFDKEQGGASKLATQVQENPNGSQDEVLVLPRLGHRLKKLLT